MFFYEGWGRRFLEFRKEFRQVRQNCILCVQKRLFGEFTFVTNSSSFLVFSRLWAEHFEVLAKVIWLGCRNCFQVTRGDFRENCFLKTNSSNWFIFFRLWAQKLQFFGDIFSTGLSKLHSLCPERILDWTVFSTEIFEFFHSVRAVRKIFWHFRRKSVKRFVRTAFYV